jgi:hypothetical protein
MVKVIIGNQTGHTELEMSGEEAIEQILNHPTHWAYINGLRISKTFISCRLSLEVTAEDRLLILSTQVWGPAITKNPIFLFLERLYDENFRI